MDCMLFTFEFCSCAKRHQWSGIFFLFPLMNNFNKTKAASFPMQTMLPKDIPLSQINFMHFHLNVVCALIGLCHKSIKENQTQLLYCTNNKVKASH